TASAVHDASGSVPVAAVSHGGVTTDLLRTLMGDGELPCSLPDESRRACLPRSQGGPLRRGNFNRSAAWPQAVAAIGAPGLHFHDLRHTGNTFAAASGAGLRDLMARMGHDSERAALIYQHEARGADAAMTHAIDAHVDAERSRDNDSDGSRAGVLVPAG
ncbi:MAG TPA: tyrosine-type recombinase/integrase, partial [Streptosporangiaceae bacterium]